MCKHDTRSNGFPFMTRYIMRAKETRAQYITQHLAPHPHAHDTFLWLFWDNPQSFSLLGLVFGGNRVSSTRKSLYSSCRSKPGLLKGASPEITLIRSVHHAPMLRGRGIAAVPASARALLSAASGWAAVPGCVRGVPSRLLGISCRADACSARPLGSA